MGWQQPAHQVERVRAGAERHAGVRGRCRPTPTAATARPGRCGAGRTCRRTSSATPTRCPYAELHAHSSYSFLDGASSPEELLEEAERLGLHALAITDHDGFYGIVRFAEAAETASVKTVFGAELSLGLTEPQNGEADPEGSHLLVLARQEEGYHRLAARHHRGRSCAVPRRGARSTTSTSWPRTPAGTGWC